MFEILVGSQRSQFRYAKKAGEQKLSGFCISQAVDANSFNLSSSFTIARIPLAVAQV